MQSNKYVEMLLMQRHEEWTKDVCWLGQTLINTHLRQSNESCFVESDASMKSRGCIQFESLFCCSWREWHCIFVFFGNKNTMKIDGLSERKPLSTEYSTEMWTRVWFGNWPGSIYLMDWTTLALLFPDLLLWIKYCL